MKTLKLRSFFITIVIFNMLCTAAHASFQVYFSPFDNCEAQFLQVISKAKKSIKISCFGLTNEAIGQALIDKHKHGVKVLICEDKMQSGNKSDWKDRFKKEGIEVVVKPVRVLEHNKMISVDGQDAIIGSWNLSGNAQSQDNSITVFQDEPDTAVAVSAAIDRIYKRDSK